MAGLIDLTFWVVIIPLFVIGILLNGVVDGLISYDGRQPRDLGHLHSEGSEVQRIRASDTNTLASNKLNKRDLALFLAGIVRGVSRDLVFVANP